ncbi:MAG: flagellar hook protein FlgE [Desulfovibrio sp.]|nr:flagellar hook protein FlgE [Desulfovibrio sp.]MBI4959215.1 flagellar hook protein FlgE [Desulfovibrio sp.]
MSLSTSMWTGVTGLSAHGEKMGVIGNNLANVNTTGYKSQRMDFQDFLYTTIATAAGTQQLGQGVRIQDILSDFSQGALQTTNQTTDMAISGTGFFEVRDAYNQATHYTRAGNFTFNKNGYLVNPNNYTVQGWQVNRNALRQMEATGETVTSVPTQGTVTDVRLDTLALAAQATTAVSLVSNLDPRTTQKTTSTTDPFFSMFQNYNFNPAQPTATAMPDTAFGFQNTIKVYDQRGASHTLSVYYDRVSDVSGREYWQYMVTCPPLEDGRTFTIGGVSQQMISNSKAGVLMLGTLAFNDSGALQNITAYTLNGNSFTNPVSNLSDWTLADISSSAGYPEFTANFRSVSGANYTTASNAVSISMNFGLKNTTTSWNTSATDASMLGQAHLSNAALLQGINTDNIIRNNLSSTNFEAPSAPLYVSQDGYPPGTLQDISVSSDGVLTGKYSNGQSQELYVLALADFASPWGLRREGGNLYAQTTESGEAIEGRANTGRFGSISSNSLETSNVDMATQMVDMITTQRGFQANSKVITTADTMLSEIIQLKR